MIAIQELIQGEGGVRHSRIAVDDLIVGRFGRTGGLNPAQVEVLVRLAGAWPPLLVQAGTLVVIDGVHRIHAARAIGREVLDCELFEGSDDECFVEFVRRNSAHGLALSLSDRREAAGRICTVHPEWSDRRIAEVCALAPTTVAVVRRKVCPTDQGGQFERRIGRDGRSRPVNRQAHRTRVLEAQAAAPTASLRAIAAIAGTSPETVRLMRRSLEAPTSSKEVICEPVDLFAYRTPMTEEEAAVRSGVGDRALESTDSGRVFVEWFASTFVDEASASIFDGVPISRVYEMADECRRRASVWQEFATELEGRTRKRASAR